MTNLPSRPGLLSKPSQQTSGHGLEKISLGSDEHLSSSTSFRRPTHEHDASLSQASSTSLASSSTRSHPSRYIERDSDYGRGIQDEKRDRDQTRCRSRSPDVQRQAPWFDQAARRSTAWEDWRMPRTDPSSQSSNKATQEASPSKSAAPKVSATAANKRFANDISRWNHKQSELHATQTSQSETSPSPSTLTLTDSKSSLADAELASCDYKDLERIACLLCQRKFKSVDTLHRHENESQLHKHNLASIETCRQAMTRKLESVFDKPLSSDVTQVIDVASLGFDPLSSEQVQPPPSTPMYRDRASERRAVFGADTPSKHKDASNRSKVFAGPKAIVAAPAAHDMMPQSAPEKPIDSDNIGSKLLAMMGWSRGQGLGAKRDGRTDIVETKIYKPGVGLGSSTPSDTAAHQERASAQTSHVAFSGYVDRAKDRR